MIHNVYFHFTVSIFVVFNFFLLENGDKQKVVFNLRFLNETESRLSIFSSYVLYIGCIDPCWKLGLLDFIDLKKKNQKQG